MRTVRRLLYRDVVWSVVFVALAFLSLFFFIDFLDELEKLGRNGYTVWRAFGRTALLMPGRLYELMPIAVLIGTIYAMARLAQSSEFTILRTGGLGPGRALGLLLALGLGMSVVTFVTGEYLAPWSEQQAERLRSGAQGGRQLGQVGAWLKEQRQGDPSLPANSGAAAAAAPRSYAINVRGVGADGLLQGIRIFEHDAQGQLLSRIEAASGRVVATGEAAWQLHDVRLTEWPALSSPALPDTPRSSATPTTAPQSLTTSTRDTQVRQRQLASLRWPTTLAPGVVAAAVSPIDGMSTLELWRYSRHLSQQAQTSQRYELQFWKRALYPLACIVMVALALPFAYLHARAGGVSLKVFGGIMLGISFVLLNNVAGHLGMLNNWTPWLAASVPSLIYLGLSLAAFGWLVRYR